MTLNKSDKYKMKQFLTPDRNKCVTEWDSLSLTLFIHFCWNDTVQWICLKAMQWLSVTLCCSAANIQCSITLKISHFLPVVMQTDSF